MCGSTVSGTMGGIVASLRVCGLPQHFQSQKARGWSNSVFLQQTFTVCTGLLTEPFKINVPVMGVGDCNKRTAA